MITGSVSDRHALLPVVFRIPDQPDFTIDFVVDTGFTGALALPPSAIAALGLPYSGEQPANLANDAEVELSLHAANLLWNGVETEVRVLATGRRPLCDPSLLDGHELLVQYADQGLVTVEPL